MIHELTEARATLPVAARFLIDMLCVNAPTDVFVPCTDDLDYFRPLTVRQGLDAADDDDVVRACLELLPVVEIDYLNRTAVVELNMLASDEVAGWLDRIHAAATAAGLRVFGAKVVTVSGGAK